MKNTPDSSTPADIAEPEIALPSVELSNLSEAIRKAAGQAKWTKLSPVQTKAIPYLIEGRDLMVQARTGSGKTGAFLLPMLDVLEGKLKRPQALILVPTRELALL